VNDYEILLMLDPEAPEERREEILARTRELVEQGGGAWERAEPWGRRPQPLAFEIGKHTEAYYHLLTFSSDPAALDEVVRVLKITDGVMRHMATVRPSPHRRRTSSADTSAADSGAAEEYAAPEEGA
jgi:small subunit ribosomal protein S6